MHKVLSCGAELIADIRELQMIADRDGGTADAAIHKSLFQIARISFI